MQGEHSNQSSFFGIIYEDVIPADHLLRKLAGVVDFSLVSELVRDCYCPDNGRPSWDPLVLFKAVFLQFLYDWPTGSPPVSPFGGLLPDSDQCASLLIQPRLVKRKSLSAKVRLAPVTSKSPLPTAVAVA